jgi:hypothetical protein
MVKKKALSPLERKCLMRFYLHELKLFRANSNDYVKSLGVEGGYETILSLTEDEPLFMKVAAHDEENFVILLDESCKGQYTPLFIMKNGKEEIFEEEVET